MLEQVGGIDPVLQRVLVFRDQLVEQKVGEDLLRRVQGEVTLGTPGM